MAKIEKPNQRSSGKRRRFDSPASAVFANSAVASAGAGLATVAATGMVWPAVALAVVGAVVGYTATNQIPKDGK